MASSLQQNVQSVGKRARRLVLLHAAAWVVCVGLAAALAAGVADYLLRYPDRGVRLIVSLAFLGAVGWSLWRFWLPAWRYRPNDVETARRIERRFPQLRDRLSSAVAFLRESETDPRAGSVELRRAVIAETQAQVEQLNLHAAIEPRPARRALLAALAATAVVGAVGYLDPASAALAARRLAMPWSNESWPLWNDLAFENPPRRLAKGAVFEVELFDKNQRLPEEVHIQYWLDGEEPAEIESQAMKPLGDKMLARRENVTRSFRYRAVGGDHRHMPWISLEVVEPPQIAAWEIALHPPAYTGWPAEKSGPNLRALEGTIVALRGTANKPLREARVVVDATEDLTIPLAVAADKHGFALAPDAAPVWRVASSGAWRLLLTDETGVTGGAEARHELHAVPDRPPTLSLDGDDAVAYVTPRAVIPVTGVVKDDLAIHTIELRYLDSARSDQDHQTMEIFRGPPAAAPAAAGAFDGQTQRVDFAWDLSQLSSLEPGVQLVYHLAAADYKPQEEKSASRRLVIVSDRELEDRIGRRHSDILARLAEALDKQRAVRTQITSLEIQLDQTGALTPRDHDHLQSAELNQRQVQRMLTGEREGVEEQIAGLLQDVRNNRLDSPDVLRRMNELLGEVRRLGQDHLPAAQSGLIDALKESQANQQQPPEQQATPPGLAARATLKQAGEHQDAVIAALEQMLGELSQWDNYRRVARDLNRLRRDQDDLGGRVNELRLQSLGKDEKDLTTQERATLKRLAQQQAELARRFEQTQARMRDLTADLEATDPLAAETLADALDAAARMVLAGKMGDAARNLEANRLGDAAQRQKETSAGLEELLNVLANRREHELGRLVEKLRQAAAELQEKQQQLKELRKKLADAAGTPNEAEKKRQLERLTPQQQQLADEIARLARRLERLQAERASQSAAAGASQLSQAGAQTQQGDADQAQDAAAQAERDLEDAEQSLEAALAQAEQDLFFEQLSRLDQAIAGMIKRQKSVVDETLRLDRLAQQGELTWGQKASVAGLASVERTLADEANQFAEKIAKAKAFEFGLRAAVREMLAAAAGYDRGETGAGAQQAARAALDRLERLAEALKTDPSATQAQRQPSGQGSDLQQPPTDGIAALAELKLLKLMQEELNQRTAALETSRRNNGRLTPEEERQLGELAQEQGRLAELLLNLAAASAAEDEKSPDQENAPDPLLPPNLELPF